MPKKFSSFFFVEHISHLSLPPAYFLPTVSIIFSVSVVWLLEISDITIIMQYWHFTYLYHLRFICILAHDMISFFLWVNNILLLCIFHIFFFLYLSIDIVFVSLGNCEYPCNEKRNATYPFEILISILFDKDPNIF
jgi:hypothetical protein